MNLSVSTKLFLMIVITSVVVALCSTVASSISFKSGFLRYLNEGSHEQIAAMEPRFAESYRKHGSWQFLREDTDLFYFLVNNFNWSGPVKEQPKRPSTAVLTGLEFRITLLDDQQRRVNGNPEIEHLRYRVPVVVDGRTVGWLAEIPFEVLNSPAYERFEQKRIRAVWIVAAISVLLAAVVAFPLSRWLTGPLRKIATATHRLAAGDFAERVGIPQRDEIGQLARRFDAMALTLDRNEKMRRSFMASISHELRTPLAIMRAELEAIQDGIRQPNRVTMQSLEAEVAIMSKLVTDLYDLALSDINGLALRKSALDVAQVLRLAIDGFKERLAEQELTLSTEISSNGLVIDADEQRIHQLFNNLLENCCRYTNRGGRVRVRLGFTDAEAVVDFDDSEPGVPDSEIDNIFKRFFRVESSRNRATGGAGLGLAICREIVNSHGGKISSHHSLLGGLGVHIVLPLRAVQES